jgi:ferrochelatase
MSKDQTLLPAWAPDTAVMLVNLGTPRAPTRAAVSAFLAEFLSDRRVVELPALLWQPILRGIVIPLRAARVAHAYETIWDGDSPLRAVSERQRAALQDALRDTLGDRAPWVRLAMSYQGPVISDVLREMLEAGVQRVCVLPLYPQYSATTTAAVFDQVARFMQASRPLPHFALVRDYHDHPGYIEALAASVREYRATHGNSGHLLLSFHGIPEVNVRKGDPYQQQSLRTGELLAEALQLRPEEWTLAFQSRFGRQKWLQPYTDETLRRLAREGIDAVDVICPAFSADCLETLEEMAIANRELFIESGGREYRYIPCLNERADHVAMLAAVARAALGIS